MTVKELKEKIKDAPDDYPVQLNLTDNLSSGGSIDCSVELFHVNISDPIKRVLLQGY